jgi:hypothetical protein
MCFVIDNFLPKSLDSYTKRLYYQNISTLPLNHSSFLRKNGAE